jgi:hypothetical protein
MRTGNLKMKLFWRFLVQTHPTTFHLNALNDFWGETCMRINRSNLLIMSYLYTFLVNNVCQILGALFRNFLTSLYRYCCETRFTVYPK